MTSSRSLFRGHPGASRVAAETRSGSFAALGNFTHPRDRDDVSGFRDQEVRRTILKRSRCTITLGSVQVLGRNLIAGMIGVAVVAASPVRLDAQRLDHSRFGISAPRSALPMWSGVKVTDSTRSSYWLYGASVGAAVGLVVGAIGSGIGGSDVGTQPSHLSPILITTFVFAVLGAVIGSQHRRD